MVAYTLVAQAWLGYIHATDPQQIALYCWFHFIDALPSARIPWAKTSVLVWKSADFWILERKMFPLFCHMTHWKVSDLSVLGEARSSKIGKKNPPFRFSGIEEESCWCSSQLSSISQFWYLIFSVSLTCYGICETFLIRFIQHSSKETYPNRHAAISFRLSGKKIESHFWGVKRYCPGKPNVAMELLWCSKTNTSWIKELCIFVCLSRLS